MLCFVNWAAVRIADSAWHQAQLTLRKGWLGLRSISHHAMLHILHPFVLLDIVVQVMYTFRYAVDIYNNQALVFNRITASSLSTSLAFTQKDLSSRVDDHLFQLLLPDAGCRVCLSFHML